MTDKKFLDIFDELLSIYKNEYRETIGYYEDVDRYEKASSYIRSRLEKDYHNNCKN